MDPEELKHRKTIISLSLGTIGLILLIIGATYAYFKAQQDAEAENPINIQSGAVDVLTFEIQDLEVTGDKLVDEDANKDIVLRANETNFARQGNTIADGVTAQIDFKAKVGNSQKYNLYLVMDTNELIYTQNNETPELLMYVEQPDGKGELKTINGLKYYENTNGFSGFDITNKANVVFEIAKDYEIAITDADNIHQTHEWKIKIFLINLNENQIKNSGSQIHGKVVVTTETKDNIFKLAHINSLKDVKKTANTITTSLNYEDGTNKISKYYFGIEEMGPVTAAVEEDEYANVRWDEPEETANHTFNDLKPSTNYKIYAYTVDTEGFKSNIYNTEVVATEYGLIEISSAEVTNVSHNSITVRVNSTTEGSGQLENYKYTIKTNGAILEDKTITTSNATHTFEGLEELTQYEITINAIDNNGESSPDYQLSAMTLEKTIGILCQGEELSTCFVANYKKDKSIIYHNVEAATQDGIENAAIVAGDDSYRYSGPYDSVNNYVCLDSKTSGDCESTEDLYRIIGLFKNEDEQYEIKLIKAEGSTTEQLGDNTTAAGGAYMGDYITTFRSYYGKDNFDNVISKLYKGSNIDNLAIYYWNSTLGSSSTALNVNMWKDSNLNKVNLNNFYYNYITNKASYLKDHITNHLWTVVGFGDASDVSNIYWRELESLEGIFEGWPIVYCYTQGEADSERSCDQENDLTYPDHIGLMYISDYMYATLPQYWLTDASNYKTEDVRTNNWMYVGLPEWSITRYVGSYGNPGKQLYVTSFTGQTAMLYSLEIFLNVRPTFYLTSDAKLAEGSGTKESPYRLSFN